MLLIILSVVITDQFSSYITYKSRRRLFYQALIQGSALSAPSHSLFPEEKAKLKGYKLYKQAELAPGAKDSSLLSLRVTHQRLIGQLSFWF